MKYLVVVCMAVALTSCKSQAEAYKHGCRDGIVAGLESVGIPPEVVDAEKVAQACVKLQAESDK